MVTTRTHFTSHCSAVGVGMRLTASLRVYYNVVRRLVASVQQFAGSWTILDSGNGCLSKRICQKQKRQQQRRTHILMRDTDCVHFQITEGPNELWIAAVCSLMLSRLSDWITAPLTSSPLFPLGIRLIVDASEPVRRKY